MKKFTVEDLFIMYRQYKKKFTPTGFLLYQRLIKYFETIDMISVTKHNQTSNTGVWHYRTRKYNFYLRGFKYLFIMKKPT